MKKIIWIWITLLVLSGCSSADIRIAGGNTTERQILAEVVKQMVVHYEPEISTNIINNLGSTTLIVAAMDTGEANVAGTMYTGTSLVGELNQGNILDPELAYETVVKEYYKQYNKVWFPSFGFDNTYAFMVKRDFAEQNNLKTVSDLEKIKDEISVGIDTSWMSREGDGYDAFQELYGYSFNNIYPMEISLVYTALNAQEMQVALGYSTDGRIDAYDLVILEDDRLLFPSYDASVVVDYDTLQEFPSLETIFLRLENEISNEVMQKLNRESDEERVEPYLVAQHFLEENNYFEDKEIIPLSTREVYSFMKEVE